MAPNKYKLIYFDARGRAEVCRLLFAAARVDFEDCRISFEEWSKVKPTTLFGSLPMLEVNDEKYAQAMALATFLAREFGLYGSSNMDSLMIEQVQQAREDLLGQLIKVHYAKDEATKEVEGKKLKEETIPIIFKFFNNVIENNKDKGYTVGDKLSLADLVIYEGTQFCVDEDPKNLDSFKEIKTLRSKVESIDAIKKYLGERKPSPF